MRTIKFRAWFKPTGKMFYDVQADSQGLSFDHYLYDGQHDRPHENRFVVMEYAGMVDKNGREIYEGDIIMFMDASWTLEFGDFDDCEDDGVRGNGWYLVNPERGIQVLYSGLCNRFEVIGNIYATPELIPK